MRKRGSSFIYVRRGIHGTEHVGHGRIEQFVETFHRTRGRERIYVNGYEPGRTSVVPGRNIVPLVVVSMRGVEAKALVTQGKPHARGVVQEHRHAVVIER